MRNTLRYACLIFFHAFLFVTTSSAQTSITSGTVTQNFDAMAGGSTLPANWKMSAAGTGSSTLTWLDASNVLITSFAANSGTPTTGGRYNWGTTAGTDRAIGFIADAGYNSPNAVMAFYRNTSGATIQSFTVVFNIERYKIDVSTCSGSFYTSGDGISWQAQPLGDVGTSAFAPAAVSYSFASPTSVARSLTFNSANFANNANLYFKWIFVNTGSTTSQGLGLDDVAITVNTATITANLGDILTDANANGSANPGETITYRDTIKNTGTANALTVVVADTTAPAGSTKVTASTKTSAVAVDDSYATTKNTQLTGQNVLTNDFGFPAPQVLTYGTTASGGTTTAAAGSGATDNGGTIVITSGGALTYTPANNFTGVDKFKYIAGTGVGLPDNDAVVTIAVNAAAVTFTSVHTDPLCNGNSNGTITVTASGGSGTYLYSKDNGVNYQTSNVFNGLAAGTYQLVVKDAITGTTQTGSETLTNPAAVTFTFTKTDITCNNANNGSIVFNTTSGGTGPYTYSITGTGGTFQGSTSFTNLAAAAYTLVVKDNNGCLSATSSSTVVNPPVVTVSGTTPVALIYQTAMSTVTYTKSGGTGTLTFSQTGTLPTGVTFTAGAGTLTGTPTQTGSFPISIIATDANGCTGNLAVTINVAPKIVAETFTDVGNTQLAGGVAAPSTPSVSVSSLAVNDVSDAAITYAIASAPTQGTISLNSNGTFLYTPAVGNVTTATFTYTGTSNGVSSAAVTATINFSGKVWYVQAGGAAGDGRSNTPLNALPSSTLGATSDFIYIEKEVSGTTPGGITLQTSQQLIGAATTLSVPTAGTILTIAGNAANTPTLTGTITLANSVTVNGIDMSTGASAAITNGGTTVTGVNFTARNVTTTSGTGISITGTGNSVTMTLTSLTTGSAANAVALTNTAGTVTISGGTITGGAGAAFNITGGTVSLTYSGSASQATAAQPLVSVSGGHATGTITFNTGTLSATNGTGLQFDNADGTYNFNGTTTLNGGDAGIDILNGSGGTFNFPSGIAITNPTNEAIKINASTANVTYSGTFTKTNNAVNGIFINGETGGTVNINGTGTKTLSTTTANAINLTTNAGAIINFSGNNLLITTTSGVGFNATGGATAISVTGTGNTITSTTGTALNVANTTIGAGNLNFQSISANGAASGIIVNNTGTSGGLVVTGTGSAGTGGTIQNSTSDGVVITSSQSPNLSYMNINDQLGGATDDGMVLTNITGTVTFTGLSISGSPHNGITFDNFNTNLTSFVMTNCTIACPSGFPCQPSGSVGNDGILLVMRGTSILTSGLISGCTFSGVRAVAVQIQTNDAARIGSASGGVITAPAASNSFTVQSNTFTGNGQGIDMGTSQVSSMAFQILNNTIVGKLTVPNAIANTASSHAINAFTAAGADTGPGSHFFVGKIDGNNIGTLGVKDSGSGFGNGIRVVVQGQTTQGSVTVSNNTIREVPNATILNFFGQNGAGVVGSNTARFKIINNIMPAPSGSNLSLCGPANTPCADAGIFILADEATPVCNIITGNTIYDLSTMNGSFDIYLAERIGPPAGAQLTVEGTGGSNSAYIIANNTLAGAQKFVDEGANTSQVALNSCGAFPSIIGPPDNPTGKADNNLKIEQQKTKLYALKNVIPIKKEGEKWVSRTPEKVNK